VATADLSVLALGRPDVSASEYIAEIQRRLQRQKRVRYRMHAPFEQGVPRVYTILKLDERRDRPRQTLDEKVRAVEERLGGDI
jgi:uncharacterized protein YqgV (UPF0045/DUF77 family)